MAAESGVEPPRPPSRIVADWRGGYRFDSGRPGETPARFDGDGTSGQSPPDALLSALASCAGVDVVDILTKRRTPPERLRVAVTGSRREQAPRRFLRIELDFVIDGGGAERVHAERAVRLAFESYCSVAASLAQDMEIVARVTLDGVAGDLIRQPAAR